MIEFPNLDLRFYIGREAFKIYNLPVYWYGIIISLGLMLAVYLGIRNSRKNGIEPDDIIDLALFGVPAALIGARLYYVIFSWSEFQGNLIDIINIRRGGLAIYGGLIGAIITAYIFCRVRKLNVLKLLDYGLPYFVLAQAIGRWGNFINQEAFGTNTNLPWGMTGDEIKQSLFQMQEAGMNVDPNLPVHPTFLYESLINFTIFFLLMWYAKRKNRNGEVFSLYMVFYGIGRFFIEGLRTDSLMIGSLRVSQLLSLVFFIVFVVVFIMLRKKGKEEQLAIESDGESSYSGILQKLKEEEAQEEADIPGEIAVEESEDSTAEVTEPAVEERDESTAEVTEPEEDDPSRTEKES